MTNTAENGSEGRLLLCVNSALKRKARGMVILDVKGLSSFADYFVICSANSDRQVRAIASWLREDLKKNGMTPLGVEGEQHGRWVLMDYDDIIIHIFHEPVREFYDIERLWVDAARMEVADEATEIVGLSFG
ncbi:MAG TPA: ribosome silencing factor [Syntrophales bacterium]|nr:ribosome silencing factor [Syntrophales bacterium]HOM07286.1 ribosome silencing factor [Syntrophales bacterium]HOO00159.1 ribosome silencing factor [Syntrophales bacterium]HPQ06869.1 ribosome silencing factor [Syntrophales bacterium]HRS87099.1 ribosome silencing factor [Syntrophales bacterium]